MFAVPSRVKALALAGVAALALAGCNADTGVSARAFRAIPSDTIAKMEQLGTSKSAPVLLRAFKKEAELEVWKMKADGRYVLLKTYPMCRWSGQLGPKKHEGDRQVPEGFYAITPGHMNPNSNYYLSFNIGYPNAYDKAHGRDGGAIMVHGACSSAGCFSMTDDQIAEIYAIAREAFAGGQRAIQMQSMPFRMNAENLAKYRFDQNMPFWKQIKEGMDAFDVTRQEPQVAFCGRRYVFNGRSANGARLDASAACPPIVEDEEIKSAVLAKRQKDERAVAELVSKGVTPVRLQYADGGQHPSFASVSMVSRPEALAQGPVEIPVDATGKAAKPALVQVAATKALTPVVAAATIPAKAVETVATPIASGVSALAKANVARAQGAPAVAAAPAPEAPVAGAGEEAKSPFYKRWLGLSSKPEPKPADVAEPLAPQPADVPLPPRRASAAPPKPQAALENGMSFAAMTGLRRAMKTETAGRAALPSSVSAYAGQ